MAGKREELNTGPPKTNPRPLDCKSSLNHCLSLATGFVESVSRKILA